MIFSLNQILSFILLITVAKVLEDNVADARSVRVNIRNHPYIYQIANPGPVPDPISGTLLSAEASEPFSTAFASPRSVPGNLGFKPIPVHPVRGFSAEAATPPVRRAAAPEQITVSSRNNVRQAVRQQQPQQFTPSLRQEFVISPRRQQPASETSSGRQSAELRNSNNLERNAAPADDTSEEAEATETNVHTPYKISYDSVDVNGTQQKRDETKDDKGVVRGSYSYTDPLGIFRVVEYIADEHGFRASIRTNEPGMAKAQNGDPAGVIYEIDPTPNLATSRSR